MGICVALCDVNQHGMLSICTAFSVKCDVFRESITKDKCYFANIAQVRAHGIFVIGYMTIQVVMLQIFCVSTQNHVSNMLLGMYIEGILT